MLITFAAATIGDDANKYAVVIEQLGGASLAQIEALAGGANPATFPRGNVQGELVFRSGKSYASVAAAWAQFKTEYARLNTQGSLVLTAGATTLTFANAICRDVRLLPAPESVGERMALRYTFVITTCA